MLYYVNSMVPLQIYNIRILELKFLNKKKLYKYMTFEHDCYQENVFEIQLSFLCYPHG